jgi:cyclohexanecarboxyl-CoA dehydrogenase
VPLDATLGDAGAGKSIMYARFNVSRCLSPLAALGAAAAVLEETKDFAKKRIVYGRPIAMNQSISFPLVEHHAKIEAGRLLAYRALVANDRGEDATADAAMAKYFGISTGVAVIQDCLQMFGANGYLKDNGIEQRLRDVYSFLFTGGTLNIMKLILVRHLLGVEYAGLRP